MTTEVEIRANHGWPVRVTLIHKGMVGEAERRQVLIVLTGERKALFVSSSLDLLIHEIQHGEEDFEKGVTPGIKQAVGTAYGVAITGEAEVEAEVVKLSDI